MTLRNLVHRFFSYQLSVKGDAYAVKKGEHYRNPRFLHRQWLVFGPRHDPFPDYGWGSHYRHEADHDEELLNEGFARGVSAVLELLDEIDKRRTERGTTLRNR